MVSKLLPMPLCYVDEQFTWIFRNYQLSNFQCVLKYVCLGFMNWGLVSSHPPIKQMARYLSLNIVALWEVIDNGKKPLSIFVDKIIIQKSMLVLLVTLNILKNLLFLVASVSNIRHSRLVLFPSFHVSHICSCFTVW